MKKKNSTRQQTATFIKINDFLNQIPFFFFSLWAKEICCVDLLPWLVRSKRRFECLIESSHLHFSYVFFFESVEYLD